VGRRVGVITEVRGKGLLVAAELDREAAPIVEACRGRGLLVNAVQPRTLRFAPPLIVSHEEVREALALFEAVLAEVVGQVVEGGAR